MTTASLQPYTRLQMHDGSSFIFIMSSVWRAKHQPHLCHLSYSPLPHMKAEAPNEVKSFACDFFPDAMVVKRRKQDDRDGVAAFTLSASVLEQQGNFNLRVQAREQSYEHHFVHPVTKQKLRVDVAISENTPHSRLGPMWIARFLPLPLKWHVFSTRSKATVTISDNGKTLLKKDGLAHQEKNWGIGFPTAWIWCQGFATPANKGSLTIAGGALTSFAQAFMLAYRSPSSHRNWDIGPASTIQLFGFGPFVNLSQCESRKGELELTATNLLAGQRIVVKAKADPKTFQVMSAPLPRGHKTDYCHESFEATYNVTLYEKRWFKPWQKVEEVTLENSALEFGGDWSHWWLEAKAKQDKGKQE